jgi:glycosyltransferase domain-containing protein
MNNLPIIICSRNRHHYLNRIFSYYRKKKYDQNLIIVDSSTKRWNPSSRSDLRYLYLPGYSFQDRLSTAIKETKSEFLTLCADDDFMVPEGINHCAGFLNDNPDFSCAHGRYGRFVVNNNKISCTQKYTDLKDIIDLEPIERIKKAFVPTYIPHVYAVHRRDSLEKVLSVTQFSDEEFLLIFEHLLTLAACLNGKCKRIPFVHCFREMENEKTYKLRDYTLIASALLIFIEVTIDFVKEVLPENENSQLIRQISNIQLEVYFKHIYFSKIKEANNKSYLKSVLSLPLIDYIRTSRKKLKSLIGVNRAELIRSDIAIEFEIIKDIVINWNKTDPNWQ